MDNGTAKKDQPKVRLGRMSHIGIVVKDLDAAMDYYGSVFGLGPFQTETYELKPFIYKGEPANARVRAAISYSGSVFIELVQVLEGETPHTEFLREKGEGIHHVAFLVRDLDQKLEELAKAGIEPVMRYRLLMDNPAGSGETRDEAGARVELNEVYLNSDKIGGAMIQLMEFKEVPSG